MTRKYVSNEDEKQQRAAEVLRLRRAGVEFSAIGDRFGVTKQRAYQIWKEALAEIPAEEAREARTEILERLNALLVTANRVLGREHFVTANGKVVYYDNKPLIDDGPILAAVVTILSIEKERAKIYGVYPDTKVSLSAGVRYEVVGVSPEEIIGADQNE